MTLTSVAVPPLFTPMPCDLWCTNFGVAYRLTPQHIQQLRWQQALDIKTLTLSVDTYRVLGTFRWNDVQSSTVRALSDPQNLNAGSIDYNLSFIVLNARLSPEAMSVSVTSHRYYKWSLEDRVAGHCLTDDDLVFWMKQIDRLTSTLDDHTTASSFSPLHPTFVP